MAQAAEAVVSTLEQLGKRVQELEGRVAVLEARAQRPAIAAPRLSPIPPMETPQAAPNWQAIPAAELPVRAIPTFGKAVLGMAGAYLLRAIAESGAVPILPVLLVAIVYAALWMVWAARVHSRSLIASATYAVTSAMILPPMLFECALRFQVLSPTLATVVLVGYLIMALAFSWRQKLELIPWVATLVSVGTMLTLVLGTHALVPLTTGLLLVALAIESAACLGYRLSVAAVPALAADLSVWLLVFVMMTSSQGVPDGYPPVSGVTIVAFCLTLLAVYGASIGVNSIGLRRRIGFFDIAQGGIVLALASYGSMCASHGAASTWLGVLLLLLAGGCYWAAMSRFAEVSQARNHRIIATWALILLVAGVSLLFPANLVVAILCLAAAAAAFEYTRAGGLIMGLHASAYLAAAAAFAHLPSYIWDALAGTVPVATHWPLWAAALCAALCYVIGSHTGVDHWARRLLWAFPAALAAFSGAALAVVGSVSLSAARMEWSPSRLSVIRTIVTCALALILALAASRWKRTELGWLAYLAVALGSLKLVAEDFRFGTPASLVVSLLFYGLILILLPQMRRRNRSDLISP